MKTFALVVSAVLGATGLTQAQTPLDPSPGWQPPRLNNAPTQGGDRKMGQSACEGTDYLDSMSWEIKCRAGHHRPYDGEKRPWESWNEAVQKIRAW